MTSAFYAPRRVSSRQFETYSFRQIICLYFLEWYFWHPRLGDESSRHKFRFSISSTCVKCYKCSDIYLLEQWQSFFSFFDNFHYQFLRFSFVHAEIVGTFPICLTRRYARVFFPLFAMIKTFWDARNSWRLCQEFLCGNCKIKFGSNLRGCSKVMSSSGDIFAVMASPFVHSLDDEFFAKLP